MTEVAGKRGTLPPSSMSTWLCKKPQLLRAHTQLAITMNRSLPNAYLHAYKQQEERGTGAVEGQGRGEVRVAAAFVDFIDMLPPQMVCTFRI